MKKAFTLIELLLALTMLTVLIIAIMPSIGTSWRTWRKLAQASDINQTKNIVMTRLVNDLRGASQIVNGSTSSEVSFILSGETLNYTLINSKVRRKKGGAVGYLTNENEIKTLLFDYPTGKMISIKLDDLATTLVLRN